MLRARTVRGLVAITFASGSLLLIPPARVSAQIASPSLAGTELLQVLGDTVVGNPESARTLRGFSTLARWETGEWRYRITSGARRGETEVESLAPIAATAHGETWKRTIGQESTLHLREIAGGSLVLPSQITHPYRVLVYFDPPLSYLLAGMEFGLFFLMQRDEAWSERSVYDSGLAQMLAAESLGYSSVWIAEHHFNDYGLCPAPQVLASFVAARTKTLRLGMGVSLLPLHHPVDLAEELAVLDVVSGGRLDIGIGRGGTLQDYQTFQSDRADSRERVEEGIALMRHAWSGTPFDFQGRFHSAERLHVRPAPTQRPHPPIYIAANSEDSVLSAARLGVPTLLSFL